jgi:predicted dehydrogenase
MLYSVVIVGLGNMGLKYDIDDPFQGSPLTHASAFYNDQNFNLLCAVDINRDNRLNFERVYGLPTYDTIENISKETTPDIFVVATPACTHLTLIEEVFSNFFPKVILCEKPISENYADSVKINNLCVKNNCDIFVNYPRRSSPSGKWVKNKIQSIKEYFIGTIVYSGETLNNAPHFIDLCEFWFGKIDKLSWQSKNNIGFPDKFSIFFSKGRIDFMQHLSTKFSVFDMSIYTDIGIIRYKKGGETVSFNDICKCEEYKGYFSLENDEIEIILNKSKRQADVLADLYIFMASGIATNLCRGKSAENHVRLLNQELNYG